LENLRSMENISVALHGSLRSAAVHFKVGGVLNKDHVATSYTHTLDDPIELKSPGGAVTQCNPGTHPIISGGGDIHCRCYCSFQFVRNIWTYLFHQKRKLRKQKQEVA
jgi:hypothetical protein